VNRRSAIVSVIALLLIPHIFTVPVLAQNASPVLPRLLDARTETMIDFPRGIRFRANLSPLPEIEEVQVALYYTVAGNDTEHLVVVPASGRSGARGEFIELMVDLQSEFVPSGVTLEYHWDVRAGSTTIAETTPERVTWHDTRWPWQTTRSEQVVLHSYNLTPTFAASILGSAQSTVTDLERRYALARSQPVDLWVYPSADDFRGSQQQNSREAVAGASYPGFFLVVAVIPEGDAREVGRVIPHEFSHQVLYQATRNPFTLPPLWFDEGLATHYQTGGTDGYPGMVAIAFQEDRLFTLDSLDTTFPYAPAQSTLAYAASWSAVEYVRQRHGDDGIERLIAAFATGAPYDTAIRNALGVTLSELDDQWRTWAGRQPTAGTATNGTPVARPVAA